MVFALEPGLAHVLGAEGPWATVLEVGLAGALLLASFGLVLLSQDEVSTRQRVAWGALIVLVPIVGPLAYLLRRRRTGQ